ncbi:MAG: diguanylate cyclase [Angelakisella sp.]
MKEHRAAKPRGDLSFRPVLRYFIYFYLVAAVCVYVLFCTKTFTRMAEDCNFSVNKTKSQIDYRIDQSLNLLSSLANDPYYMNPSIPFAGKAASLQQYSDNFGYMMIKICDRQINVWNPNGTNSSLANRSYMQTLYSTGRPQITDSFAAGADGVTLNYTLAMPIIVNGDVTSCLFAAIYFDEIEANLADNRYASYQDLLLLGSDNQVMSFPDTNKYGQRFGELMDGMKIFGTNADDQNEIMINGGSGSFWGIRGLNPTYVCYAPIENTSWTLMCQVSFTAAISRSMPQILWLLAIGGAVCLLMMVLANRRIQSQMSTVDMLVESVQELEKKIYQNEKPDDVDFKEIISLTSKGLTDGLTGVITRTVFLNQIPTRLQSLEAGKIAALCFIDVDNLKGINDTYGHAVGDMTLKNVGYILREYEKKHEGLVGRHGGDEFILLVADLDSQEELSELLEQLTARLHAGVSNGSTMIQTQCSVGVAICDNDNVDVERLIGQADDALYSVKQSGKGFYKIYGE